MPESVPFSPCLLPAPENVFISSHLGEQNPSQPPHPLNPTPLNPTTKSVFLECKYNPVVFPTLQL